jgi:hypothetical protein
MAKEKVLSKYALQRRFKVGDRVGFSFLGDTRFGVIEEFKRKDQYYIYYIRRNGTLYNLGEEGVTIHGHVIDLEEKVHQQQEQENDARLLSESIAEHVVPAPLLQHEAADTARPRTRAARGTTEPRAIRTRKSVK